MHPSGSVPLTIMSKTTTEYFIGLTYTELETRRRTPSAPRKGKRRKAFSPDFGGLRRQTNRQYE
jgi:hypothetical protein